jgi:hypothetical protein
MLGCWARFGMRPRGTMALMTLVGHLFVACGLPLPAPSSVGVKDSGRPFPCQDRPCGCLTYDECWKGDCCCFTLEEKLAWADALEIEPPEHVRPLVEARKIRPAAPEKKPCCPESEYSDHEDLTALESSCCSSKIAKPADCSSCCEPTDCTKHHAQECPECASRSSQERCDKPKPTRPSSRWVVGIFAQRCRSQGPAGLLQLAPTVLPDRTLQKIAVHQPTGYVLNVPIRVTSTSHRPPTPPPRLS